jgi:hypothetical protein
MKQTERKVFGIPFQNAEPESPKEYDALAKKEGQCVADAVSYCVFHSQLSAIRGAVIDKLEETTKVPQKSEKRKNGDKETTVITEKDGDYVERLLETGVINKEGLTAIIVAAAKGNPFDPSVTAREAKPKKLAQEYRDAAVKILTEGKADKAAKKFAITLTGEHEKDIELIGWAVRENVLAQQRQLVAKAAAL